MGNIDLNDDAVYLFLKEEIINTFEPLKLRRVGTESL